MQFVPRFAVLEILASEFVETNSDAVEDAITRMNCAINELESFYFSLKEVDFDQVGKPSKIISPPTPQPESSAKHDQGKLQLSLVPPALISAVAEVRRYGVAKYGDPENWRRVEVDRYREALLRHVLAVWNGDLNKVDDESGLPHVWHIACNTAFIIDLLRGDENAEMDF